MTRTITTPFELQRFLNCNDATLRRLCPLLVALSLTEPPWATYEPIPNSDADRAHLCEYLAAVNNLMDDYDASALPGDDDQLACRDPHTLILSREAYAATDPEYQSAPTADALLPLTDEFCKKCVEYFESGTYENAEDPATIPEFEYDAPIRLEDMYDTDEYLNDELDEDEEDETTDDKKPFLHFSERLKLGGVTGWERRRVFRFYYEDIKANGGRNPTAGVGKLLCDLGFKYEIYVLLSGRSFTEYEPISYLDFKARWIEKGRPELDALGAWQNILSLASEMVGGADAEDESDA